MIGKQVSPNVFWWNHHIGLHNLKVDGSGNVSGFVNSDGGFVFPGGCGCPITSPIDGIEPTTVTAEINDFLTRVGGKLNKTPQEVLQAISGALEDVYREQNPE